MAVDYQLHLGDCIDGMRGLPDKSVDCMFSDPPYSQHVHECSRRGSTGYDGDTGKAAISRNRDLGFAHLDDETRLRLAEQYARVTRRWVGVFSDTESTHLWRDALERYGLEYVRTMFWHKVGSTPQFTGDRPAVALEAITLCHPKGRKTWNGGGKHGLYSVPIVLNRGGHDNRCHPTQKPLLLMRQILEDFTDPGELILDSHAGSGTTGAACLELGLRFLGWELDPKHYATASKRLAEASKQQPLFKVATTQGQERLPL